ncbi:unnamed protein product [Caenorhabditis angaria]|uniref:NADAR domain-containing protein n=1 Tax=Caenorhabditis angaria TaxID=860376 RepID=A0A9P1IIT6_9PELO|nr:unnamed protein product [Caenorhabditis angaria]
MAVDPSQTALLKTLCHEITDLKVASKVNAENVNKLKKELEQQKKANAEVHNAVFLLQEEKTNLRVAVHNLKMRNAIMSRKIQKLKDRIKNEDESDDDFELIEFDEIGRNFLMIGGRQDPLAFNYNIKFSDENGYFNDKENQEIIQTAEYSKAEQAKNSIVAFDEQQWNQVKLQCYTKAQERKISELRSVQNLLILSDNMYLASCESDRYFGTGWRKQREESVRPLHWDGQNLGGVVLMKLRKKFAKTHKWQSENEQVEAENRFGELRKYIWRRIKKRTENNK